MRPGVVQSRCSQWRMTRSSPVAARGMRPRGDAMVHGTSRASPDQIKKRCAALVAGARQVLPSRGRAPWLHLGRPSDFVPLITNKG